MGSPKKRDAAKGETVSPEDHVDPDKLAEALAELAAGRKRGGLVSSPSPGPRDNVAPDEGAGSGAPSLRPVDDEGGDEGGDADDDEFTEEGRKRKIEAQDAELARQLAQDGERQARHEEQAAARARRGTRVGKARDADDWMCGAPFSMMPWAVNCDASLSPRARVLYVAIVRRAIKKDWITAGQARLADDIGCGVQTVSRAIRELKERGLIDVQRRVGTSARTTLLSLSNVYSHEEIACHLDADRRSDG